MSNDIEFDELNEILSGGSVQPSSTPAPTPPTTPAVMLTAGGDDDLDGYMDGVGLKIERAVPDLWYPWMAHHEFVLVKSIAEVNAVIDECLAAGRCSLDLETEGLDNRIYFEDGKPQTKHKIVGFCISPGDAKKGYYIPVRHRPSDGGPSFNVEPIAEVEAAITRLCQAAQPVLDPEEPDTLSGKKWLSPPKVVIDFWHCSFDQEFLYPVTGIDWWHPDGFEDGNLACFVQHTDDKSLSLKDKAEQHLRDPEGHPYIMIKLKELFPNGRKIDFPSLSPDEPGVIRYVGSDAICTRLLGASKVSVEGVKTPKFAGSYRIEKQVAQVKRVMERNRVLINKDKVRELLDHAEHASDAVRKKILEAAEAKGFHDFEPASPKQLSDFLFTEAGLDISPKPARNEKSGQFKTDAATLEELTKELGDAAPPVLKWVVEFREQEKLLGTYLQSMVNNGDALSEFRFSFKQTGAATGRFSAPANDPEQGYSGIPVHGIPATSDLRTCFEAREGYLMVKNDYAGEELRIVTNLSNEPVWVKEFAEGDGDLHSITARAFFPGYDNEPKEKKKERRKQAKIANFALVYGGGPASIQRATGCDKMEGQRRKQAFDKAVPVFAAWVKQQHTRVKKELGVYTAFGRWIAIPDANIQEGTDSRGRFITGEDANRIRAACERHSVNYPIQGSGADIMKIAMILVHKELHRRRWLRNGGDDSVRMLLTVHDELVFEVKPFRLLEALDVLTEAMERPTKMAGPPHSPRWQVPLVTEPLVGKTWGADISCHRHKEGEKLDGDAMVLGNWVFKAPPQWLLDLIPGAGSTGTGSPSGEGGAPPPNLPPTPPPVSPPAGPPPSTMKEDTKTAPKSFKVVVVVLQQMTRRTISQVRGICAQCQDDNGPRLKLQDLSGVTLVDPTLGIHVDPETFCKALFEANLGNGGYALQD